MWGFLKLIRVASCACWRLSYQDCDDDHDHDQGDDDDNDCRNNQTMTWQNPGKIISDNVNYSAWFYWLLPSENKEKILTLFYNLVVSVTVIFCSISSQLLICQIVQTSIIHFDNWREMIFNFFLDQPSIIDYHQNQVKNLEP